MEGYMLLRDAMGELRVDYRTMRRLIARGEVAMMVNPLDGRFKLVKIADVERLKAFRKATRPEKCSE